LASLFPNAYLNLGGIELSPQTLFAIVAALAVLPTVMLCDLSILSYISGNTSFCASNDLILWFISHQF
jgi:vesicular inhibitory amino acid transporter